MRPIFVLMASLLGASPSLAQVEVGNGGDIIRCNGTQAADLNGYFFLDYVVAYNRTIGDRLIHDVEQPLTTISTHLNANFPQFGTAFSDVLLSKMGVGETAIVSQIPG